MTSTATGMLMTVVFRLLVLQPATQHSLHAHLAPRNMTMRTASSMMLRVPLLMRKNMERLKRSALKKRSTPARAAAGSQGLDCSCLLSWQPEVPAARRARSHRAEAQVVSTSLSSCGQPGVCIPRLASQCVTAKSGSMRLHGRQQVICNG